MSKIQIHQQTSPRTLPDKPPTPYEDRVIPTLRNNNKSRVDKKYAGDGSDYNGAANDDEQLNNSGGSSREDGGGGGGDTNDTVVPDQQQQEFEQEMYDPMDGTEEMNEREVREAALMNDYLGKQIVGFIARLFK